MWAGVVQCESTLAMSLIANGFINWGAHVITRVANVGARFDHASDVSLRNENGIRSLAIRRIDHVHYFRGFAILLIVFAHAISVFDWHESRELERILRYAVSNGTLFFLFISGYLFDHLSKDFKSLAFWGKKLRFVALPYLITSLPALVIFTMVIRREEVRTGFYTQPVWSQCLEFLATGKHLSPFWFIPTILMFYLVGPLLRATFRPDRTFIVLPLLFVLPVWFPRDDNPLLNVLHFLPVWVLGMAASRFRSTAEELARSYWPLFLIATVVLGFAEFLYTVGTHTYLGYMQKSVLILFAFSIFVMLGRKPERWLSQVATVSIGIFFVHSYLISGSKLIFLRVFGGAPPGSLLGVATAAVLATAASVAVVEAIRILLRRHSRYFIGV